MHASWRWRIGIALVVTLAGTVAAAACGARSELDALGVSHEGGGGEGGDIDGGPDADADVEDVPDVVDVIEDVPPECTPDVTYIYVVSSQNGLFAFKPQSNSFELRGFLNCPAIDGATPFSMAVAREGFAHILYNDGTLFKASIEDASCEPTMFQPNQEGFHLFGMGYGANEDDFGETLFVAEINFNDVPKGLGSIDTITYDLTFIGPFSENPGHTLELTPVGDGPLAGYFLNVPGPGGTLVEINKNTAEIESAIPLDVGMDSSALAVAWWGGSFYIFTNGGAGTNVTRYDPAAQSLTIVATTDQIIVGAGVSTCAAPGGRN